MWDPGYILNGILDLIEEPKIHQLCNKEQSARFDPIKARSPALPN